MKKAKVKYSLGENPFQLVEWFIWPVLLVAGAYLVSPFFNVENSEGTNSALLRTISSEAAFYLYGGVIIISGLMGTLGLAKGWTKLRKWAAHIIFFVFLYFTILRIAFSGIDNLGWIAYFLNTMFMMAVIVRLRWEEIVNDGTS